MEAKKHRSGFCALVGRPNVGKSTLMNSLIGQKIAIVSDKPQTTRNKIMCVLNTDDAQIVFLDTPGIHKPQHKLGRYMVHAAEGALKDVDVILFVVDATQKRGAGEEYILRLLREVKTPVLLAVNKIDKLAKKEELLAILEDYAKALDFAALLPLSALKDKNFSPLVDEIVRHLPEGPAYFPEDVLTDQPERTIAAESVREQVLRHTRDEVPHAVAVEIEEFKEREKGGVYIRATVLVERDSQKGIIIGAKGARLKEIGQGARLGLEKLLACPVYLDLWVKVRADWRDQEHFLRRLGYGDD